MNPNHTRSHVTATKTATITGTDNDKHWEEVGNLEPWRTAGGM